MFEGLSSFANVSNHLILIGIYLILAWSLNLINGSLGAFSLGHNGFWGMGAYLAGIVAWKWGSQTGSAAVFGLSIAAGVAGSALFGLLVGIPCLRLRGDYLAITTLGFAEIFVICARNSEGWTIFGERGLGGAAGFSLGDGHQGGNDYVLYLMEGSLWARNVFYLFLVWSCAGLTFLLVRNLLRSVHGRAILAIREDETAAELLGVNLTRYKVLAFTIGAAGAGLAGALAANYRASISPAQFVMMEGIKVLLMVVLGGLGSMSGTLFAVFILYVTEQALATFEMQVPFLGYQARMLEGGQTSNEFVISQVPLKDLWQVIFSLLLILLMLMRPQGVMGHRELSRRFCRELWAGWRANPAPPLATLLQWSQLVAVLAFSRSPWALLAALLTAVGIQAFKRRLPQPAGPAGEGAG